MSRLRTDRTALAATTAALLALAAGCGSGDSADSTGGELTVAAAASLEKSFTELQEEFEAEYDARLTFTFAGSQDLAAQIQDGAPIDVFASANTTQMDAVGEAALDPVVFVTNSLVIVVPPGNPSGIGGLEDLTNPDLDVVLCAAEVPCGAATETATAAAGVELSPVSLEQDVTSVLNKVALGEADAGLVYRTDAIGAGEEVEAIEFPEAEDAINDYPITVLADAPNPELAQQFVDFILGSRAQEVLQEAGFGDAPTG